MTDITKLTDSGWQPIATAPKDGTWVLLYYDPECTLAIAFWGEDDSRWLLRGPEEIENFRPTHWMPLPEPPSAGQSETEGESHE